MLLNIFQSAIKMKSSISKVTNCQNKFDITQLTHQMCTIVTPVKKRRSACFPAVIALVTNQGRKMWLHVAESTLKPTQRSPHLSYSSLLHSLSTVSIMVRLRLIDTHWWDGTSFCCKGLKASRPSRCPIRWRAAQEARMQILYFVSRRCRSMAQSKTGKGIQ